jgi:tetratricopeptide (TPR) repeat protein
MGDANPTLLAVDRDRAWINALTARTLIGTARHAEALLLLEGARKARWTLVQADPSVIRDQTQLIDINIQIARIHAGAKRAAEARASYESAAAVASRFADAHPGDIGIQSLPVGVYRELVDFLCATGELSAAMSSSEKAMAIQRKLFEADPSQARSLADGVRRHGIVLQKCGRPAEAVLAFREAITVLEGIASPRPVDIYDTACNQSLLAGVAADARSTLTAAERQAEADKAMTSLRRAVGAGWRNANHMRVDPDLDPLRSRRDFQALLMDMAFPADPFARP